MAVRPPGKDELAAIARGYGMHLPDRVLHRIYRDNALRLLRHSLDQQ